MNIQDFTLDIRKTKRPIKYIEVVYNGYKIFPHEYDQSRWQFMLNAVYNNPQLYNVVFVDEVKPGDPGSTEDAVRRTTTFTEKELSRGKNLPELVRIAESKGVVVKDEDTKTDIINAILTKQLG